MLAVKPKKSDRESRNTKWWLGTQYCAKYQFCFYDHTESDVVQNFRRIATVENSASAK